MRQLFRFIAQTYDGRYLIALSVIYISFAIYLTFWSSPDKKLYALMTAFYPVLLLVVYVRQRFGTSATEVAPMLFSFIGLTAIALVPFYKIFWR